MASPIEVSVPDIGEYDDVPVIELLVAVGDRVAKDQGLVTLESDKATMEVPSPSAGVIRELRVGVGDKVSAGRVIAVMEAEAEADGAGAGSPAAPPSTTAAPTEAPTPLPSATQPPAAAAAADVASRPSSASRDVAPNAGTPSPSPSVAPAAAPARPAAPPDPAGTASPAVATGRKADVDCRMLVLGAGPGGYAAAFRAADLGLDTVLVERYATLGGVCLNVGCIPSKALLHAAAVIDQAQHATDFGVAFGAPTIQLDALRAYKDKVVGQLTKGLAGMARQRKVRIVQGTGRFLSPNELEVDNAGTKTLIRFEHCIIAVGSQAVKLPGFPWSDPRIMDSTDALALQDVPKTLLVVGGGIIGLEMATVYRALGSAVTVVELGAQLMPGTDADLVKPLADRLKAQGVTVHLEVKASKVDATEAGITVAFEGGKAPPPTTFDRVLVAVGRAPNGARVAADAAGVQVTERGFIPVDRQMRTNVSHIFAIGDVVGNPMLAHKATHEGKLAAEVAAGEKREWVARVIPSVAYTDPEIAWVGVTEAEAASKGLAVRVGKFPWAASGRAIGIARTEGFTKLVFDDATHRVIGGAIVGVHAGDMISEIALAIEMGAEAADIGATIHPHPTLGESIGMAAEVVEGTVTDLYIPKKK